MLQPYPKGSLGEEAVERAYEKTEAWWSCEFQGGNGVCRNQFHLQYVHKASPIALAEAALHAYETLHPISVWIEPVPSHLLRNQTVP